MDNTPCATRSEVSVPDMVVVPTDHDVFIRKITLALQNRTDIIRVSRSPFDIHFHAHRRIAKILDDPRLVSLCDQLLQRSPRSISVENHLSRFGCDRHHRNVEPRPIRVAPHRERRGGRVDGVKQPRADIVRFIRRNDEHRAGAASFERTDFVGQPRMVRPSLVLPERVPVLIHRLILQTQRDFVLEVLVWTKAHVRIGT